jgi:hypothetical protein
MPSQSTVQVWDAFISHTTEDKDDLVRPLAKALAVMGVSIWYDEFTLRVGDSLSRAIDKGLANSRFGIVILSPTFFQKPWTERELSGLVAREVDEPGIILPVWHEIDRSTIVKYSPPLADKFAIRTKDESIDGIALKILKVVRPDLYTSATSSEKDMTAAIASDLGISDMPPEEQQQLIAQFGEIALKAATLRVVEKLAENKREKFAELAEEGDAAALKAFLDREVPDHDAVAKAAVAEEVRRFRGFCAS